MSTVPAICLLGFGEVGQVLAADLGGRGVASIASWDLLFSDPSSAPSRAAAGVRRAASAAEALEGAGLVISAVTAAECLAAATTAAESLAKGTLFLDLNSVSPGTRIAAARAIEGCDGRYVEAAVMSPIAPQRIASSILLGGPHAAAFLPDALALGFGGMRVCSDELGRASVAKMCRSVVIKGLEALLAESLVAARYHRVDDMVLASVGDLPGGNWRTLAHYMMSRSLRHGRRRAAEMREAALTIREAGLEPWMSSACAQCQDWLGAHGTAAADKADLEVLLDCLVAAAPERRGC